MCHLKQNTEAATGVVLRKKNVLIDFAKFTGRQRSQGLFFNKVLIKIGTSLMKELNTPGRLFLETKIKVIIVTYAYQQTETLLHQTLSLALFVLQLTSNLD